MKKLRGKQRLKFKAFRQALRDGAVYQSIKISKESGEITQAIIAEEIAHSLKRVGNKYHYKLRVAELISGIEVDDFLKGLYTVRWRLIKI